MASDEAATRSPPGETGNAFRLSTDELIAGACAGFAEHFVMFPFDVVKTRMQSGSASSVRAAVVHIWKEERITHLYRGCVPVLVSAVPAHAAYFGVYEATKRVVGEETNVGIAFSACCATAAHDTVSTPFDVVKQRMQMDEVRRFSSSYACTKHLLRTEGVSAFFVSLPTTVAMNLPHYATYWLVYEGFLAFISDENKRDRAAEVPRDHMAAGFLAGGLASAVSFPFDAVKTQLQLGRGRGFFTVLRNLVVERGLRGLFAGVVPRMLYTAPSGAIMMVTYEAVKRACASASVPQP